MSEQIQVCEGVWRTRDGREIAIRARDFGDSKPTPWCWCSESTGEYETWRNDGWNTFSYRYHKQPLDLIEYLRPLPGTEAAPEPAPEPQPVQVREGVWRTRDGREIVISLRDFGDAEPTSFVWFSKSTGEYETWRDDGRNTLSTVPQPLDLVEYLRPLPGTEAVPEPAPEPQPVPEPEPVQACEGVWRLRNGWECEVRRMGEGWKSFDANGNPIAWWNNGRFSRDYGEHEWDLIAYVGPLPEPAPEAEPVQVRPGVWKTRDGEEVEVRARDITGFETEWRWIGSLFGVTHKWRNDGRWSGERDHFCDLVQFLRPLPEAEAAPEQQTTTELVQGTTARDYLEQQSAFMTSERDEVANELRAMTDHCNRQQEQMESLSASRDQLAILLSNAQCAHDMTKRQLQDMTAERSIKTVDLGGMALQLNETQAERDQLRKQVEQLQTELREAQAGNCRAVVEAHLIGAQSGKQAAFETVLRWIGPLVGAESDDAAALLHALPGCLSRLAEQEGVTL